LGRLDQVLVSHHVLGVDTAPFIYLWERSPRYYPLSENLFRHLSQRGTVGVTSGISLIEACVYPQRQGRLDLVQAYERALIHSQQVRMMPIDTRLARRATVLRAQYNLLVPDAIQVAAALEAGATLFVTNDRKLCEVREIQILLFEDYVDHAE